MEANLWWLRLCTPAAGQHWYWLGFTYPEDGFQPQITQASDTLDLPDSWYDMYSEGQNYYRGIYQDPPQSFFNDSVIHGQGWFED